MTRTRGCLGCAALALVGGIGVVGCGGLVGVGIPVGIRAERALHEVDDALTSAPGRQLETSAGRIHVQTWGDAGPRVLLVHGSSAWSGTWAPAGEALAARGFQVTAVDLPPFGYSARPTDADYTRPSQAARIWAAIDALGWERTSLVGHSFGAGPVMEAAMTHPDRVDTVVLVSGALSLDIEPGGPGVMGWGVLRELAVAATFAQPAFMPTGLREMAYRDEAITDAWIARYRQPLSVRGTTPAVADWLPELLSSSPCQSLDPEAYRAFGRPVVLIWGDHDTATPPAQMDRVASLLPDATPVLLPDVGHLPPLEVTSDLVELLAQHLAPAPPAPAEPPP